MESASATWVLRVIVGAMFVLIGLLYFRPSAPEAEDIRIPVPAFSLTERSGRTVSSTDLLGKIWIAGFVFTRCTGPCPAVTATMARLQHEFADLPNVRLVTFTVDPERDQPDELKAYAERFGADPERWLFLTGKENEIYTLLRSGFLVGVERTEGAERTSGNEVMHSTKLAVVDRKGRIRMYASGLQNAELGETEEAFDANLRRLREKAKALLADNS